MGTNKYNIQTGQIISGDQITLSAGTDQSLDSAIKELQQKDTFDTVNAETIDIGSGEIDSLTVTTGTIGTLYTENATITSMNNQTLSSVNTTLQNVTVRGQITNEDAPVRIPKIHTTEIGTTVVNDTINVTSEMLTVDPTQENGVVNLRTLRERNRPSSFDPGSVLSVVENSSFVLTENLLTRTLSGGPWLGCTVYIFNRSSASQVITVGSKTYTLENNEDFFWVWTGEEWKSLVSGSEISIANTLQCIKGEFRTWYPDSDGVLTGQFNDEKAPWNVTKTLQSDWKIKWNSDGVYFKTEGFDGLSQRSSTGVQEGGLPNASISFNDYSNIPVYTGAYTSYKRVSQNEYTRNLSIYSPVYGKSNYVTPINVLVRLYEYTGETVYGKSLISNSLDNEYISTDNNKVSIQAPEILLGTGPLSEGVYFQELDDIVVNKGVLKAGSKISRMDGTMLTTVADTLIPTDTLYESYEVYMPYNVEASYPLYPEDSTVFRGLSRLYIEKVSVEGKVYGSGYSDFIYLEPQGTLYQLVEGGTPVPLSPTEISAPVFFQRGLYFDTTPITGIHCYGNVVLIGEGSVISMPSGGGTFTTYTNTTRRTEVVAIDTFDFDEEISIFLLSTGNLLSVKSSDTLFENGIWTIKGVETIAYYLCKGVIDRFRVTFTDGSGGELEEKSFKFTDYTTERTASSNSITINDDNIVISNGRPTNTESSVNASSCGGIALYVAPIGEWGLDKDDYRAGSSELLPFKSIGDALSIIDDTIDVPVTIYLIPDRGRTANGCHFKINPDFETKYPENITHPSSTTTYKLEKVNVTIKPFTSFRCTLDTAYSKLELITARLTIEDVDITSGYSLVENPLTPELVTDSFIDLSNSTLMLNNTIVFGSWGYSREIDPLADPVPPNTFIRVNPYLEEDSYISSVFITNSLFTGVGNGFYDVRGVFSVIEGIGSADIRITSSSFSESYGTVVNVGRKDRVVLRDCTFYKLHSVKGAYASVLFYSPSTNSSVTRSQLEITGCRFTDCISVPDFSPRFQDNSVAIGGALVLLSSNVSSYSRIIFNNNYFDNCTLENDPTDVDPSTGGALVFNGNSEVPLNISNCRFSNCNDATIDKLSTKIEKFNVYPVTLYNNTVDITNSVFDATSVYLNAADISVESSSFTNNLIPSLDLAPAVHIVVSGNSTKDCILRGNIISNNFCDRFLTEIEGRVSALFIESLSDTASVVIDNNVFEKNNLCTVISVSRNTSMGSVISRMNKFENNNTSNIVLLNLSQSFYSGKCNKYANNLLATKKTSILGNTITPVYPYIIWANNEGGQITLHETLAVFDSNLACMIGSNNLNNNDLLEGSFFRNSKSSSFSAQPYFLNVSSTEIETFDNNPEI